MGSRRACEDLIREGRVTVNGLEVTLGQKIDPSRDLVAVDGVRVQLNPAIHTFAFHKPAGVLTTLRDERGRPDLTGYIPDARGLVPVGRLDKDTEGLLLLTNDGELANRLMHPSHGVEKEYLAEVDASPSERQLARLRRGVELDDGPARALSTRIVGRAGSRAAVRLVMGEGRKREVRRMLATVGLPARRLVRVRLGPIRIGRLKAGQVRELVGEELRELYRSAGL
jgi:pseudouridine synthase